LFFDYLKEQNKVIISRSSLKNPGGLCNWLSDLLALILLLFLALIFSPVTEEALTAWEMLDFHKKWKFWPKWTGFLKVGNLFFFLATTFQLHPSTMDIIYHRWLWFDRTTLRPSPLQETHGANS